MIFNLGLDIEVYPVPPSIRLAGGHCLELPGGPFDRIRTKGHPCDYGQHDIVRASRTHMDEHPPFEGTDFQVKVWNALKEIPRGEVRTYTEIAVQIGHPNSARAVANACGQNPYPPIVPCHRVVRSDGGLGGYSGVGGVETKRRLLSEEGVSITFTRSN